jgi:hypothetical protein
MLMQVFHFQSKKMYYSPHETASQEVEFALLPRETALVDIHPPITCRHKKIVCVQIQNSSTQKLIIVKPNATLGQLLTHPYIHHKLVTVDWKHVEHLKKQWERGISTWGLLKHAFTLNNTGLSCGGIGAQCLH